MSDVTHNPEQSRFELAGEGVPAVLTYVRGDGTVRLEHTVVPPEMEGRGVGSQLAAAALAWARQEGLAVVPRCSFVRGYLERHPEAAEGLEVRAP